MRFIIWIGTYYLSVSEKNVYEFLETEEECSDSWSYFKLWQRNSINKALKVTKLESMPEPTELQYISTVCFCTYTYFALLKCVVLDK